MNLCLASQRILIGRHDGHLELWHSAEGYEVLPPSHRHRGPITCAKLAGRASSIAISGGDDEPTPAGKECVRFTDLTSGRPLSSFTTAAVTCIAVRPGGLFAVTGHSDGKAYLWDVDGQRAAHVLDGHHSAVSSIAISRCSAVTGGQDMTCR